MIKGRVWKGIANRLPETFKRLGKGLYYRDRQWAYPALRKFGTVQDLYYWVADGNLDTLLLLQNHFSAFYPSLNTGTQGTVSLYDSEGCGLGRKSFALEHCGGAKFRVSSLLDELGQSPERTFGTLEVKIDIPAEVLHHLSDQKSVYFWDRFYISYTNSKGQTCFVHGVDKTHIYREGNSRPIYWYEQPSDLEWAPEIPVDINDYQKFSVIMINRTPRPASVTLTLSDVRDHHVSWTAEVSSQGVHRFELTKEDTEGLIPTELRMRVLGMPSQYGRPMVFKEFANGAISAMHC